MTDRLTVGDYTIIPWRGPEGGFWIEHKSGEGMQISEAELASWIANIYQECF